MEDNEEIIKFAEQLITSQTESTLSFIQRTILRECLGESQKTYAQIAEENQYSENYIKQYVAPKLWQLLSSALREKVNKTNCRALLTYRLNVSVGSAPQNLVRLPKPLEREYINSHNIPDLAYCNASLCEVLESPEGQVPLTSPLYVVRDRIEETTCQAILQPGAFIRIKAPKKMGKTSLLSRILAHGTEQGYATVRLSLHSAETEVFNSVEKFLRWFCAAVTRKLGLESKLDCYWDQEIGALISCTIYFEGYLLEQISMPIILALDELNQVFDYPDIARDFLSLLRSWHEETKDISVWQKLRFIIVHSTDIHIPLDTNQSPFNVGLAIELPPFNYVQVNDLAQRHYLHLQPQDINNLIAMLGGFPYLIRLALYYIVRDSILVDKLLQDAATDTGIYSNHLHYQLRKLQQNPELIFSFQAVIRAQILHAQSKKLDIEIAVKLRSQGLINLEGDRATVSCELYKQYFGRVLGEIAGESLS